MDYKICGIVLAGGSLGVGDVEIFNQLLYCDVFRGQHSTGVFTKRLTDKEASFHKDALPSFAYQLQPEYIELVRGKGTYAIPPIFLVGHNRHATRGAINANNAHPFQHEHITLVHNGTLTDQSLLPESNRFVVDSDNIAYSIAKIGAEETIQKLNGAYTLIWHDNSDDTLHIIRNKERPFHLCRIGRDWFGASEEDMLMWILNRNKSVNNRMKTNSEHFECKVGVEYIFDVSGPTKKMTLVEEKEHTLPTFTLASYWGGNRGDSWLDKYETEYYGEERRGRSAGNPYSSTSSSSSNARSAAARQDHNNIAIERGLKIRRDQKITAIPCGFESYASTTVVNNSISRGKMVCYVFDDDVNEYFECDVHNILEEDYEESMKHKESSYEGTIQCISVVKDMVRCVLVAGKFVGVPGSESSSIPDLSFTGEEFDDDIPFSGTGKASDKGSPDDECVTGAGYKVTRKFWESFSHGECGGCGEHIAWKDAPKAIMSVGAYWHPHCLRNSVSPPSDDIPRDAEDTTNCSICAKEVHVDDLDDVMSKYRKEDICRKCARNLREERMEERRRNAAALASEKAVQTTTSDAKVMEFNKDEHNVPAFAWVPCIDKTNVRHPQISIRVDAPTLDRMIITGESTKKQITMADVKHCKFEKRGRELFAITYVDPDKKTTVSGGEGALASTFQKSEPVALYKSIKSVDGKREKRFTKALWQNSGYCEFCYRQILWSDAESCTLGNYDRVVCSNSVCKGKVK